MAALRAVVFFALLEKPQGGCSNTPPPPAGRGLKHHVLTGPYTEDGIDLAWTVGPQFLHWLGFPLSLAGGPSPLPGPSPMTVMQSVPNCQDA